MPSVLIVDDEPSILKALERLLIDEESLEVITTISASAALELLKKRQGKIDLVISDERMPGISGSDFLAQVQQLYPETIRIILTGYADQTATIKAINEAGVYRYISKPWDGPQLLTTIRDALEIKQLKDRNEALNLRVIGQKNELQKLNENLEHQVQVRTDQLRKSLETLKLRGVQLANQRQGTIALLNAILSTYDSAKSRIAGMVTELWKTISATGTLKLSESGLLAAQLSAWLLGKDQTYFQYLATVEGFEDVLHVLELVPEQCDGKGPNRVLPNRIPVESRLLRIIFDHFTISPGQEAMSKQLILSRCDTIYDPSLAQIVYAALPSQSAHYNKPVILEHLIEGMQTAEEVRLCNGAILLASGVILNEKIIAQLKRLKPYLNSAIINISMENASTEDK